MEGEESSSSFPMGETAQEKGHSHVPECYVIPTRQRPSLNPQTAEVPLIDLAGLKGSSSQRCAIVKEIRNACRRNGSFPIINHGAPSSALGFFGLPAKEKVKFISNDVNRPVRYGTSLKDGADKIQFWRVFLKHYAHPLEDFVKSWPQNPPYYREKIGECAMAERKLALEIMGAITESLGIGPASLKHKMKEGMQVMVANGYPPCPQPSLSLGLPPHSDYSFITILLQSSCGFEILNIEDGEWRVVPELKGALQVHVGDHLEVLSSGMYKSVVHRATLNEKKTRFSIASLHSLGMNEKMGNAKELVNEQHPIGYKESSFRDFLKFLGKNDVTKGKNFIETVRIRY